MDAAPLGITIADLQQPDEPLVYANEGFQRITGYDQETIVGQNCRFLQGEETDPETVERMRSAIDDRESVQLVVRNYRKDGTPFWNEITMAPIPTDAGRIRYYVGFQQDVSERIEHAEELTTQRDSLEVLNELVRHDIRNDLQVIMGSAELLEDGADPAQREHLDVIRNSAQHAVTLTQMAREMADVHLATAETEPIAVAPVVYPELETLRRSYPDAVVTVAGAIPEVRVQANEMLGAVVRNLVSNAIQHNESADPHVTVSARRAADQLHLEIADDGPGIPPERRARIFERGETFAADGTGLGLYLVRSLVDSYGGAVAVRDREDGTSGTVFTVTLPLADGHQD